MSFTGPFTDLGDLSVALTVKWHYWRSLHNQYHQCLGDAALPGPVLGEPWLGGAGFLPLYR